MSDEHDGSADYATAGRYFRGHCLHGLWAALVTGTTGAAQTIVTPCCGEVELTTLEP